MFASIIALTVLVGLAFAGVVGSFVSVSRDGYRHQPTR